MKRIPLASLLCVAFIVGVLAVAGCSETSGPSADKQQQQQQKQNAQASQQARAGVVMPQIKHSAELQNQVDWYNEVNDPNHESYLYYFTSTLVYGPFVMKGKCSSTESQLTSPATIVDANSVLGANLSGINPVVVPAPQPDGSYGQNEAAIFCFTENGHHMMEFSGPWILSDFPLVGLPTVNSKSFGG